MIAIIDITGHNLTSLTNAIRRLGYPFVLTHDIECLKKASHIILPGVGRAKIAMQALRHHGLVELFPKLTQPILGICLGMQLLFDHSEEDDVDCLRLIPGQIKRLPNKIGFPIPHMGWNRLHWVTDSPLAKGLDKIHYVYFVHSYALLNSEHALAKCQYSEEFTAIVQHKHVYGMQFHPEKSADVGLSMLNHFLQLETPC